MGNPEIIRQQYRMQYPHLTEDQINQATRAYMMQIQSGFTGRVDYDRSHYAQILPDSTVPQGDDRVVIYPNFIYLPLFRALAQQSEPHLLDHRYLNNNQVYPKDNQMSETPTPQQNDSENKEEDKNDYLKNLMSCYKPFGNDVQANLEKK